MGTLKWIQQWYFEQCDDDWENQFGICIETLDNPGWSVKVSLENTDVKDKTFENINIERTENDWIHCKIEYDKEGNDTHFFGNGGPMNLGEILDVFKLWIEK